MEMMLLLKDSQHVVRQLVLQSMEPIDLVLTPFLILLFSEEELPRQSVNCTPLEKPKEIFQQAPVKNASRTLTSSDTLMVHTLLPVLEVNYRKQCRDTLQFSENRVALKKVAKKFMKFLNCTLILN